MVARLRLRCQYPYGIQRYPRKGSSVGLLQIHLRAEFEGVLALDPRQIRVEGGLLFVVLRLDLTRGPHILHSAKAGRLSRSALNAIRGVPGGPMSWPHNPVKLGNWRSSRKPERSNAEGLKARNGA